MPTRRRSRSSGRHINSPRGRSSSRGKSNGKNNAELTPLALLLKPVIGNKSLTHKNYLLQEHHEHANEIRTPGGTIVANYHKKLTPEYLPKYPYPTSNSYGSEESNEPTSAEMRRNARIAYATTMINNPLHPVRTRSANRPEHNIGAYRRGRNPLGRRESF